MGPNQKKHMANMVEMEKEFNELQRTQGHCSMGDALRLTSKWEVNIPIEYLMQFIYFSNAGKITARKAVLSLEDAAYDPAPKSKFNQGCWDLWEDPIKFFLEKYTDEFGISDADVTTIQTAGDTIAQLTALSQKIKNGKNEFYIEFLNKILDWHKKGANQKQIIGILFEETY